jgi:hypothetical protein
MCVYTAHTQFFSPSGSFYTRLIRTFYPLSLCLFAADIHVSSFLLCLYAAEIGLSFPLCLYAGDKHVSTAAVSISIWFSPFIPTSRFYTQLICIYHHLCIYRQIIYTCAPCMFLRASEVCFYTLSVSVFSWTHFHVCYYIFGACSVSSCIRFHPLRLNPLDVHRFSLLFSL